MLPRQVLRVEHQYEFAEHVNTANTVNSANFTPVAGHAAVAGHANTASFAENATTVESALFANTVNTANFANSVNHVEFASFAEHANTANSANTANNATHANNADNITNANNSTYFDGHPITDFALASLSVSRVARTLNASELNSLYATPVQILSAPGANQVHVLLTATFFGIGWSFLTIKFIGLQYGNTGNAGGILICDTTWAGTVDPTPKNTFLSVRTFTLGDLVSANVVNKPVYITNEVALDGGANTGSQVEVILEYFTATV